jgi:putative ABC transport system substrate-binding protein
MWCSAVGFIVTLILSLLVALLAAKAQSLAKVPRIGWLSSGAPLSEEQRQQSPFFQGLRELGWVEGKNIAIEQRSAEGKNERLPELAAELVQLRVDVIVAGDSRVIPAAKDATNTIPIVMTISADPVRGRLIESLTRPGGNVTGLTILAPELVGKRLELLREAVPGISRVAVLGESVHYEWSTLAEATQALGLQLHAIRVDSPDEFAPAFAAAMREHADALLVLPSPLTNRSMHRIIDFAAQNRLPAMYGIKAYVQVGGLMAYGWSIPALYHRAAAYVDKILKGAKPADLPVERPMKFELVINLKTAEALGITIPPLVLFQADEVIRVAILLLCTSGVAAQNDTLSDGTIVEQTQCAPNPVRTCEQYVEASSAGKRRRSKPRSAKASVWRHPPTSRQDS